MNAIDRRSFITGAFGTLAIGGASSTARPLNDISDLHTAADVIRENCLCSEARKAMIAMADALAELDSRTGGNLPRVEVPERFFSVSTRRELIKLADGIREIDKRTGGA